MRTQIALIFVLVLLGLGGAACGGGQEVAPTAEEVEGTIEAPADTGTTTGEGETETETEDEGAGGAQGDAEAGKAVYDANGCGGCHTLAAAGSTGNVGPNLDESKPSFEEAKRQIENGGGGMPAYKDQLDPDEIDNVTAFVVENAGKG